MNTLEEFRNSLINNQPPAGTSVYLQSLWYDAKGDWETAHKLADSLQGADACSVHAYLHREEGDNSNAAYWYRRANKKVPDISLQEEWKALAENFLNTKEREIR